MYELTKHEELVLLSVLKLKDDAYGVTIRKNVLEVTGRSINYGSLCNTLYQLVRKGLIFSKESEPLSRQGGRRKVIYYLSSEGKEALKHAYDVQKQTWDGMAEIIFEGE